MKMLKNGMLILLATCFIQASSPEPAVFIATSPCDAIPRSWLSIPATAECEMIKWNLVGWSSTLNRTVN